MKDSTGKVLILVENLSVPFDQRVWREATALTEAGYAVSVICPKGEKFDTTSHETISGVSIYRYSAFEAKAGLLYYFLEFLQAIVKMMLVSVKVWWKEGFDVIQTCNPPDLLFLVTLPYRLLGKKVIFDHHDLSPETYQTKKGTDKPDIVYRVLLFMEKLTFLTAHVSMATNESYKKVALTRGGMADDRVIVVRNGPDLKRVHKVPENPALKMGKPFLLCFIGTMGPQDGVDYLLRSVAYLAQEKLRNDFCVRIVGGGIELDNVKRYAKELGIENIVTFTGRITDEELVETLSTADICLCPDPKTPLNDVSTMNKTMEYMSLGKPVVAYDLIETRVSAGDAALYATDNDEKIFAEKIVALMDSPELREKLGSIGMDRVNAMLSWEHSKKHLYAAYEKALKAGAKEVSKVKTFHREAQRYEINEINIGGK